MNKIVARTDWAHLCAMSRGLCNSLHHYEGEVDESIVYVSDNSFGGRHVEFTEGEPVYTDYIEDPPFGGYDGVAEEDVVSLEWTSASSETMLQATKVVSEQASTPGGLWFLVFEGCDTSERDESQYVAEFAIAAVELAKLELTDAPAVLKTLRGSLDPKFEGYSDSDREAINRLIGQILDQIIA